MGSQQNGCTSYQPSDPKPCANNCGFFGTAATMNLCSKCYKQEQASSTVVGGDQVPRKAVNQCWSCNKKVGSTGVGCNCGRTFCWTHRWPEKHECTYDFKVAGRDVISYNNPLVKAEKVDRF